MSVCGLYVSHVGYGKGVVEGGASWLRVGRQVGEVYICNVCKTIDEDVRSPWIIVVNK